MALACLITIQPLDIDSGARVPVRVCSAQDRAITGLNGVVWEPAITALPSLTMNLWNGDFKSPVDPGNASFSINMETVKQSVPMADRYYWQGAPVEIRAEQIGAAWPWTVRFSGVVGSASRKKQSLSITANVDTSGFSKNVLTGSYAGTGGVEGGSDIKNRLKPLILGYARNVEPVLINADYSIYQFSAYGPIEGVTGLFERGSAFGSPVADYADYAALLAATIPAGQWGTCLAQGLIRLGAPAYGVITGDVKGYKVAGSTPRLTGAIIKALATIAGVSSGTLNTASLDALDAAVPFTVNIVLSDQVTFIDIANQMALACNAQAGISLTGSYFVTPVNLSSAAALTLDAQGRALPQVVSSDELEVSVPYWKTIMGANRSWRVHTADEIAFSASLIDRGLYSATETYREGNIVTLEDGSQWIYTNSVASAGNAPPAWPIPSNDWWKNSVPPTSAANLTYADGQTLQSLQPDSVGSTRNVPAQLLQDGIFLDQYWSYSGLTRTFPYLGAPSGVALEVPFESGVENYTVYGGAYNRYFQFEPGRRLFLRVIASTDQGMLAPLVDGDLLLTDGGLELTDNEYPSADWNLEIGIEWFTADAVYISRTIVISQAPASGEVVINGDALPPAMAYMGRLIIGHQNQTGKTGSWSVWSPWVAEHQPSADVTAENTPILQAPADVTILASADGTVKAGQLPRAAQFLRKRGLGDYTNLAEWAAQADGCTATIDNSPTSSTRGRVTITAMDAATSATVRVTSSHDGVDLDYTLKLSKVISSTDTSSGTSASRDISATISSGSYGSTAIASATISLTSGQVLSATLPLGYSVSDSSGAIAGKWQYSVAGANSWTDFASEIAGSDASISYYGNYDFEYVEGYAAINQSKSGLSSGSYDVRLLLRKYSGSASNIYAYGTATIRAE